MPDVVASDRVLAFERSPTRDAADATSGVLRVGEDVAVDWYRKIWWWHGGWGYGWYGPRNFKSLYIADSRLAVDCMIHRHID